MKWPENNIKYGVTGIPVVLTGLFLCVATGDFYVIPYKNYHIKKLFFSSNMKHLCSSFINVVITTVSYHSESFKIFLEQNFSIYV